MDAVIVVDAASPVANVFGGEGMHGHGLSYLGEFFPENVGEELAFVAEIIVDAFLIDSGPGGDFSDGGAVGAVVGKFGECGGEDFGFGSFDVPGHGSPLR